MKYLARVWMTVLVLIILSTIAIGLGADSFESFALFVAAEVAVCAVAGITVWALEAM